MYEIRLNDKTKDQFVKAMKIKLLEKGMKVKDLADELDRPVSNIYNFISAKDRPNRFLAAEIAQALGMNPKDWRDSNAED